MLPHSIERGFFKSAITLSDIKNGMPSSVDPRVQILRVGSFSHPKYGEFQITSATLSEMKQNFDNKIRGIDVALDYFHNSDEAASGWLKALYLSEDEQELWGEVDWTPKARRMLAEREIRYFSPDFAFQWTDPETNVTYKNVLFGGGLTNRPFVKDMAAIVAAETKGDNEMDAKEFKALQEQVKKLAEGGDDLAAKHAALMTAHAALQGKHDALKKQLDDSAADDSDDSAADDSDDDDADDSDDDPADLPAAKKQLSAMKAKLAEYAENAKKATQAAQLAEKESKFAILLSEGKACVAQKDAFVKGDMETFIKLAQNVNLGGKGSAGGAGADNAGDRDDRVLKLAEEKTKADPKLPLHEAIKLANKEIK